MRCAMDTALSNASRLLALPVSHTTPSFVRVDVNAARAREVIRSKLNLDRSRNCGVLHECDRVRPVGIRRARKLPLMFS